MSLNGISFIVRIRNEEDTLEKSIRSLFSLTIPHEIILILHRCTDRSLDIAKQLASKNLNIRYLTYDHEISRAGYETLATDIDSKHSFITYCNFCFSQAKLSWKFKWDADFIASPGLIQFLNSKEWVQENATYKIMAKNNQSANWEDYLIGSLRNYTKYIFWETPSYILNTNVQSNYRLDITQYIEHASELSNMKSYWKDQPWYIKEDSDEAREVKNRIELLERDFGKEPEGMARAQNKLSDPINLRLLQETPSYINLYK